MQYEQIQQTIENGALAAGLMPLSSEMSAALADYLLLLQKWNEKINLTAVRSLPDMITHHILDCLAVVPRLSVLFQKQPGSQNLADIGTGAGLPGLIIALLLPQVSVTCIDAVEKKIAFVQQAIGLMKLRNCTALAARVQDLDQQWDVLTCRAYASMADIIATSGHLLRAEGYIAAMKGPRLRQELAALPVGWHLLESVPLQVPGLNEERSLALVGRQQKLKHYSEG